MIDAGYDPDSIFFELKLITFCGRETKIILQNSNGPCPLLAIANILLLKNKLSLDPSKEIISMQEIITELGSVIVESAGADCDSNTSGVLESAFNVLPQLGNGLDLNLKFDRVNRFEYTQEFSVFDILDMEVFHAWVVDPDDRELHELMKDLSYNQLTFKVAEYQALCDRLHRAARTPSPAAEECQPQAETQEVAQDISVPVEVNQEEQSENEESFAPQIADETSDEVVKFEEAQEPVRATTESQAKEEIIPEASVMPTEKAVEPSATAELPAQDSEQSIPPTEPSPVAEERKSNQSQLTPEETRLLCAGPMYQDYLTQNPTQMTYTGLHQLYEVVREEQLGVLLHNNHFSVIHKHKGKLYLLVTDAGFKEEPALIWELLDEINGDTVFANAYFDTIILRQQNSPVVNAVSSTTAAQPFTQVEIPLEYQLAQQDQPATYDCFESDLELAQRLQREEDMLSQQLQQQQAVRTPPQPRTARQYQSPLQQRQQSPRQGSGGSLNTGGGPDSTQDGSRGCSTM